VEANKNRRKSHYPWTKDGGQVITSMKSILQEATAHTTAILLAHEIAKHLEKLPH
jgi:hypothetical protein